VSDAVTRYLESLNAQDWDAMGSTLTDGPFERVGPFCDVVADKAAYLEFLDGIVPTLAGYSVRTRRISAVDGVVYAEINESFTLDGKRMDFPEILAFDVGDDGLITRVQVYMMRPDDKAAVGGGRAGPSGGGPA
jgi:hypothetical protein